MNEVLERTNNRMRLWPGMLYGSLRRMREAGLIEEADRPEGVPADGVERHFYRITPLGRRTLAAAARRLEELVEVARAKDVFSEREAV
jgi:DNA-binding PadR family transcriptional regulator